MNSTAIYLRMAIGGYLIYLGYGLLSGLASHSEYRELFALVAVIFIAFGLFTIIKGIKDRIDLSKNKGLNVDRTEAETADESEHKGGELSQKVSFLSAQIADKEQDAGDSHEG